MVSEWNFGLIEFFEKIFLEFSSPLFPCTLMPRLDMVDWRIVEEILSYKITFSCKLFKRFIKIKRSRMSHLKAISIWHSKKYSKILTMESWKNSLKLFLFDWKPQKPLDSFWVFNCTMLILYIKYQMFQISQNQNNSQAFNVVFYTNFCVNWKILLIYGF